MRTSLTPIDSAPAISTKKIKPSSPRPHKRQQKANGQINGKSSRTEIQQVQPTTTPAPYQLPSLPTFTTETGYREVYNTETGKWENQPLTLLDLLYPTDDDVGVVKMSQSPLHDQWSRWLATMLQAYFAVQNWLILHDVLVHWGRGAAPAKGPDVTVIKEGRFPADKYKSYRVVRDGPLPEFVVEITSEETRETDFHEKKLLYAAVGVKEYLLIDLLPEDDGDWKLYGFRLEDSPFYKELTADAEGGLSFETVGLRFVAEGRERINVFHTATGERLLNPIELKARADIEAATSKKLAAQLRALGIEPDL